MSKIILQGYIILPEAERDNITAALPGHISLTRQEPGCLIFEVTPDHDNPEKFYVYEEFNDQQAFDQHQKRVKQSLWGKITGKVERHYTISHKT